jgi:acyl-CoA reductase-like NAD-dependent aldehyde dehydrogenase
MTSVLESAQTFISTPGKILIGGEFRPSSTGESLPVENPATEEVVGSIASASGEDVDNAVRTAREAFDSGEWTGLDPHVRGEVLHRIGSLIEEHSEELAAIESVDTGMPLTFARIFIAEGAKTFKYFSGWPSKAYGETNSSVPTSFNFTVREPMGVCAQVVAWNGPLGMSSWKIAPALAGGNTVVLKPAEQASLSPLRLGALILEAGVPEGVVNILTGTGEAVGSRLVRHPGIDKISFTGSSATGREIVRASAENYAEVTLETGGKSPNIVFADADLDAAAATAVQAICVLTGQTCSAGSRLFVEASVYDEFMEKLVAAAQAITVGDPLEPTTFMGPLVSRDQWTKVQEYISSGRAAGAEVVLESKPDTERGYFVTPTIFGRVANDMQIAREEIFGPVLSVIPFSDDAEAIRMANDTNYGLAAAVWTSNVKRAHLVSRALDAGTVWINQYGTLDPALPWGGFKISGLGKELGHYGMDSYTRTKSIFMNLA